MNIAFSFQKKLQVSGLFFGVECIELHDGITLLCRFFQVHLANQNGRTVTGLPQFSH